MLRIIKPINIIIKGISFVFLIALLIYFYYLYAFVYLKNFRPVIPGVIYRSSQPSNYNIKLWHEKYKINSIINLRGDLRLKNNKQIQQETKYSNSLGIEIKSIKLSFNRLQSSDVIKETIDFINTSKKPLLIHCLGGVDRTGLVSAIALILNNESLDRAYEEITYDINWFLPFKKQCRLKQLLVKYALWLDKNNISTSKDNFIYWANNIYTVDQHAQSALNITYTSLPLH